MSADYDQGKIKLIDNSGYVPTIDPTYVVLGMLDEYMGWPGMHGKLNDKLIDRFYPAEQSVCEVFVSHLKAAALKQKLPSKLEISTGPLGHITISSSAISKFLRRMYGQSYIESSDHRAIGESSEDVSAETTNYGVTEGMFPRLSRPFGTVQYDREPVDCRFAYLLGAHIRYGDGNKFQFANADHKAELIISFLERLGARWVSKAWTVNTAPAGIVVRFAPDEILARLFGTEPMDMRTFSSL